MNEFFATIYQEVNEHIRASNNKRDQIIAFYLILLGFLFSLLENIIKNPVEKSTLAWVALFLFIGIGVFGFILVLIIIEFRMWHTIYVNTAVVIQNLALHNLPPTDQTIRELWEAYYNGIKNIRHLSVERLTFIAFLIIAFLPFYMAGYLLYYLVGYLQQIDLLIIFLFLGICHIIYILYFCIFSNRYIRTQLARGYSSSWVLRIESSLRESTNEQNSC